MPAVLAAAAAASIGVSTACAQDYALGADLSFTAQAEADGTVFRDQGVARPALQIFRDHGYYWIRLRLFHTPSNHATNLPNDLPYTIAVAQQAKALGYKFLLDFHYSDTWADPGQQAIPAAWAGLTHAQLVDAVHEYTRDTIITFREAGVLPDMVQIGNEIHHGILWPHGRIFVSGWPNFAALLKAGIRGVDDGHGDEPRPLIMLHIAAGGDTNATRNFFDNVLAQGVEFDVIGQSYYPWWHGTFDDLRNNLAFTAGRYEKDIYVVETAYTYRRDQYPADDGPFPETPQGQRDFLEQLNRIVMHTPNNRGRGIFWWEPANHPWRPAASRNMFDRDGNALPVITVFDKYAEHRAADRTPRPSP